jgi:hypothetical protein
VAGGKGARGAGDSGAGPGGVGAGATATSSVETMWRDYSGVKRGPGASMMRA